MAQTIKDGSVKAYVDYKDSLKLNSSNLDTDGTLAANSDSKIASQKAVKTYADTVASTTKLRGSTAYRSKFLDNWLSKLAASNTSGPLDIVIAGDSISSGESVSSPTARPYPWILSDLLARKDYRGRYSSAPAVPQIAPDGWSPALSPWGKTMTTCQGTATNLGFGRYSSTMTNGQVATQVVYLDAVSVLYNRIPTGGKIEVRDGAGGTLLTTIDTAGTARGAQMWTSSLLTYGLHTIELTAVCTGGETVVLNGVYSYSGNLTKGIRVWPAARSGISTATATSDTTFFLDFVEDVDPDLVILATGANDTDAATYTTNMQALITSVKSKTTGDVALWGCYAISGLDKYGDAQAEAARDMASANNIQLIDAFLMFPNIRGEGFLTDGIHPTYMGAKAIAWHIYANTMGDPIGFTMRELSQKIGSADFDTDGTLASNSNTKVASQKAIKTYADTKAPKASPTFTGTVTSDNFTNTGSATFANSATFAGGNFSITAFGSYPILGFKDTADTKAQISFGAKALNTLAGGPSSPTIGFGPGGTTDPDTTLSRAGVNQFSIGQTSTGVSTGTLQANISPSLNAQTGTSYTLVLTDAGKQITRSNGSASTQTLPQNSDAAIPIGTVIPITNIGAGEVTFQGGTGATITGIVTISQYQQALMTKVSTNSWNITGADVSLIGTQTLTNKTLTSPIINTGVSGTAVDTDTALTANSDTKLASQKATKAYVDAQISTLMANAGSSAWSNSTTETSVQTGVITIAAGTIKDGDTVELEWYGNYLNNTGANQTNTWRFKLNGTAIWSPAYTPATSAFAPTYTHRLRFTRLTSTTVLRFGEIIHSTALGIQQANRQTSAATDTVSDLDSNALTIDLTSQLSTATATCTVTPAYVFARLIKA